MVTTQNTEWVQDLLKTWSIFRWQKCYWDGFYRFVESVHLNLKTLHKLLFNNDEKTLKLLHLFRAFELLWANKVFT